MLIKYNSLSDELIDKSVENEEKPQTNNVLNEEVETESDNQISDDNGCYCDDETTSQDNSVDENRTQLAQQFRTDEQFRLLPTSNDSGLGPLPDTVTVLEGPNGAKVYLIGTAHFSEKSQQDVSEVLI